MAASSNFGNVFSVLGRSLLRTLDLFQTIELMPIGKSSGFGLVTLPANAAPPAALSKLAV
jgi:hypothetical protein